MRAPAAALIALLAAACAGPGGSSSPPIPPPAAGEPPAAAKAALVETGLGERHLLPWGALAYRVRLAKTPGGAVRYDYLSDTAAWTGALLAAEAERCAATGEPEALDRVRRVLGGLETLAAVTGERGLFARYACPRGFLAEEPHAYRWRDGGPGFGGWRWRGDLSKDQVAGIVFGLAAVGDLVEDAGCRARAARLLGDLADRVLGRGGSIQEEDGVETSFGDLSPRVFGMPVGVNAAVALGLADAAARATGEPRHRRFAGELARRGALESLRVPTVRIAGRENWNNANMVALALASVLRRPPAPGDGGAARLRREAEGSLRRILDLHRGEGNAFWIGIAAPAGAAAGATPRDLADARAQVLRFPTDLRQRRLDHAARRDLPRAGWGSRSGRAQFRAALPVDLMGANSFVWKSNPFEVLQEPADDPRSVASGVDFLAAYWPLRRAGILAPGE